jgi:hypothetical protein
VAFKGLLVLKVLADYREIRDGRVRRVRKDSEGIKASRELMAPKVFRASVGPKVFKVFGDSMGIRGRKVHREFVVSKVSVDCRDSSVSKEHREFGESRDIVASRVGKARSSLRRSRRPSTSTRSGRTSIRRPGPLTGHS